MFYLTIYLFSKIVAISLTFCNVYDKVFAVNCSCKRVKLRPGLRCKEPSKIPYKNILIWAFRLFSVLLLLLEEIKSHFRHSTELLIWYKSYPASGIRMLPLISSAAALEIGNLEMTALTKPYNCLVRNREKNYFSGTVVWNITKQGQNLTNTNTV